MNEITHFFFGYLIARLVFKKKNTQFECFFVAMAALIPDYDFIIQLIVPFEHGVFTHTILGGLLFTIIYVLIIWSIGHNFLKEININFPLLLLLATIGMLSHLLLDAFTFYEGYASSGTSHLYFWPFWNFPVHINTMFPSATYEIRVLVEVLFSIALGILILGYGWIIKKENPFLMFSPTCWASHTDSGATQISKIPLVLLLFNLSFLILIFLGDYII